MVEWWRLLLLLAMTLTGAWVSFRMEAAEIHRRNSIAHYKELPHWILQVIRISVALFILILILPKPLHLLTFAMSLAFMSASFGPVHRLGLNLTRIHRYPRESRTITWHHLRGKGFDRILIFIKNEKTRFGILCSTEATIAVLTFLYLT